MTFTVLVSRKVLGACGAKVTSHAKLNLGLHLQPVRASLEVCFLGSFVEAHFLAGSARRRLVRTAMFAACSRGFLAMNGALDTLLHW